MSRPLKVYLIAGEPSGDVLGKRLIKGINSLSETPPEIMGVGGPLMEAAGLSSLFPMRELTVMGLAEVLPRIPSLLKRIGETAADIRARKPDVVVTIDAPDFCFRVAKRIKGAGIPVVHYVAPSVWAWRPGRAAKVARLVDHVMCLLPFEPPYFEKEGIAATFVGHSILESGADKGDGQAFRERHGIGAEEKLLCVLPGSRMGEVSRLLPVFTDTLSRVRDAVGSVRVTIPTVATVSDAVRTWAASQPDVLVVDSDTEKYDAFAGANAGLAASGTVSLELAMAGVPSLIAYRVQPLTAAIARRLLKVSYVSIVNLILDRPAQPEFLQENCTAEKLAPPLIELLTSADARKRQSADLSHALAELKPGDEAPSISAARVVLKVAA